MNLILAIFLQSVVKKIIKISNSELRETCGSKQGSGRVEAGKERWKQARKSRRVEGWKQGRNGVSRQARKSRRVEAARKSGSRQGRMEASKEG